MNYNAELQESFDYLNSPAALKSLDADAYWPKWHSPWWHMLLLHEMGLTKQIPEAVVAKYIGAMNRMLLKIFPIHPEDMPEGVDPYRGSPCHCQLGNVYQVLAAWGVDVDRELPWLRPWFLRYQMADGGLNCDNEAYLIKNEVPSSMVGTIAVFEAVLLHTHRPWTEEERSFLQKGAEFLIGRKLKNGSNTKHNADERVSAEKWTKLCFPRFYLYDVLRGLHALLLWAEKTDQVIPADAIRDVVSDLDRRFPDGRIRVERQAYEGAGTLLQTQSGEWLWREQATFFPMLNKVSAVGQESPFLARQWEGSKGIISKRPELKGLLR
jgi:hypothetical protein